MALYVVTIALVLGLLLGWTAVERTARLFAKRHPELGPARDSCATCGCSGGARCDRDASTKA